LRGKTAKAPARREVREIKTVSAIGACPSVRRGSAFGGKAAARKHPAVRVVLGAFLVVRERGVRFAHLLEFLFVPAAFVRMILVREIAERLFDFVF
jgi:hypothetical protein